MKMDLMLMDSEMDILQKSKKELVELGEMFVTRFDESSKNPLQVLALVTKLKTMLEVMEKGIQEKSMNDLQKEGGKHLAFGVDFQIAEVGTKYDYSENVKWMQLQEQINELDAKRKDMETFIKSIKSSFTQVDEETGEAIQWHPASKTSTTSIKKTIK